MCISISSHKRLDHSGSVAHVRVLRKRCQSFRSILEATCGIGALVTKNRLWGICFLIFLYKGKGEGAEVLDYLKSNSLKTDEKQESFSNIIRF